MSRERGRVEVQACSDPSATCQGELGCESGCVVYLALYPDTIWEQRVAFCDKHRSLVADCMACPPREEDPTT